MASIRLLIVIVLATVILFSIPLETFADSDLQNECAKSLVNLNIMQGYEDGSLRLNNKIKRSEFVTLIVKMMGYDKETDILGITVSFNDIRKTHWAYKYVGLAEKYKLIVGTPDKRFNPDSYITYAEALTVLIRSLGYENTLQGNWPKNVINKASQLGLNNNLDLEQNKQITRGEMSVMVFNSLTINFN